MMYIKGYYSSAYWVSTFIAPFMKNLMSNIDFNWLASSHITPLPQKHFSHCQTGAEPAVNIL